MKRRRLSFNIYFILGCLVLSLTPGCKLTGMTGSKKQVATIRLFLEGQKADSLTSGPVYVTRKRYVYIAEREPFLTEADLTKAVLVDDPDADGSFSIQLTFNEHGSLLLGLYTEANKGKHIIVYSHFPVPGYKEPKPSKKDGSDDSELVVSSREPEGKVRQKGWLAAVLIKKQLSNGTFRFTPDASREEGLRIVRGLKNVIPKEKKEDKM